MTTEELLAELERRGIRVELRGEGQPVLRGDPALISPPLLRVLKWHREAIVARLLQDGPREWLWRDGHRYREAPEDATWRRQDWHPVGAWWVRQVGQTAWQSIPGRTPADVTALPAAA